MHLPFLRSPQSKASQRQHQFENSRIQVLQSEAKRAIVALHANGHRVGLREQAMRAWRSRDQNLAELPGVGRRRLGTQLLPEAMQ